MQVFTVTRPGGTKDIEYEAYVRLLKEWHIDVTNVPRVLEKGMPNRWLYAWKEREDAERFAKELRARTRDKQWRIREVSTDGLPHGPLGPVEIAVSRQRDGCTYELHPNSRELICKKFPNARLVASVFVGHDTLGDFERDRPESIWDHVAMILTGLNEDELNELDGYRIYDPGSGKVLREPEPLAHPTRINR